MPNGEQTLYGTPVGSTSSVIRDDFSTAIVEDLLAKYRAQPPAPPPKPNKAQMIFGILGDALQTAGQVRAGGTGGGQGPFISGLMRRQQQYQERLAEFENQRQRGLETLLKIQEQTNYRQAQLDRQAILDNLRQQAAERPRINEFMREVGGAPHRIRQVLDRQTGDVMDEVDLGQTFVPPAFLPTAQGFVEQPRTGGAGQFVQSPGGGVAMPVPPAGVVSDVAAGTATLAGRDTLRASYNEIRKKTAGQSLPSQVGRMFIGETRLGGALAPDYAKYVADRRAALNAYIKSTTGAQFSVKELERYETQYPEPFDPEDVAERKLQVLAERALIDMQAKLRAFPAAAPAAPAARPAQTQPTDVQNLSDDELLRLLNAPE